MEASCRKAVELGLPSIAFTEHADFVQAFEGQHPVDMDGYLEAVERCRATFPDLRILSGVELGEPHWFPQRASAILSAGKLDRVLGSVHCLPIDGRPSDMSQGVLTPEQAPALMRAYLLETLALVESGQPFEVLAHLDYPKRYWPHAELAFREHDYEEEYRTVLRAAARRGTALEVNTTRGLEHLRGLCPGPLVLGWWREEGGRAVSFGSDAHDPSKVAAGFEAAAKVVEAAGFKPAQEPTDFWRR
jgi:histidinol-phosphatase (PHP family)